MAPGDTKFSQTQSGDSKPDRIWFRPTEQSGHSKISLGLRRTNGLPQENESVLGGLGGGGVDRRAGRCRPSVCADTDSVDRGNGSGPAGITSGRRERDADEPRDELYL